MTDSAKKAKRLRLTPEEWADAADLLEQFAAQCEIAFEDHCPHAKEWVRRRLMKLVNEADEKGKHP